MGRDFLKIMYKLEVFYINRNQDKNEALINENIKAEQVLLIDNNGEQLGVKALQEALAIAESSGFDLVCVAPNAKVPVCRLIDYKKFKYNQQKNARLAKKNQTVISVKEIRLTPVISSNDFDTKLRAGIKFLEQGNKLKVALTFNKRARMLNGGEPNIEVIQRYIGELVSSHTPVELFRCIRAKCQHSRRPGLRNT